MLFDNVDNNNALLYAMRAYDNPQCLTTDEFLEDVRRFRYIKRLCRRYLITGELKHHLLLNHLVSLLNVFGVEACLRLLFLKCDEAEMYGILKPYLLFLDVYRPVIAGINGVDVYLDSVPVDECILQKLREI